MIVILILISTALFAMVGEFFGLGKFLKTITLLLLFTALVFTYSHISASYHMLSFSCVSAVFSSAILLFSLFTTLLVPKDESMLGSKLALLTFSTIGALLMVTYSHFVVLFLGIELLSIPLYVLSAGSHIKSASKEAALKYFLMGSFASTILLFGIALIYYETGSFYLSQIGSFLSIHSASPILLVGLLLTAVALCFKSGLAPFHMWVPDVYEGSPSYYTAFMATVTKMASFFAFFSLIFFCFGIAQSQWSTLFIVIALISITLGNILAIQQDSIKRLLAYSSIAHAGFLFIPLALFDPQSSMIMSYYSLAYGLSSVGLFMVISKLENGVDLPTFSTFKGLSSKNKTLTALATISLLSLAGIPLTAGFFAKFQILSIAYLQGHYGIIAFILINAVISGYYYLKILSHIFAPVGESDDVIITLSFGQKLFAYVLIFLTMSIGIYPLFCL